MEYVVVQSTPGLRVLKGTCMSLRIMRVAYLVKEPSDKRPHPSEIEKKRKRGGGTGEFPGEPPTQKHTLPSHTHTHKTRTSVFPSSIFLCLKSPNTNHPCFFFFFSFSFRPYISLYLLRLNSFSTPRQRPLPFFAII